MFFVEYWKLHAHDSATEFLIRSSQNRRILLKFFTEDLIDQLYSHDVKSTVIMNGILTKLMNRN